MCTVLRPDKSFVQVITEYGYPVISKEVSQTVYEVQRSIMNGKDPAGYRIQKLEGTLINKKTGQLSSYNIPKYKFLIDAPFRISNRCCNVMKKNPAHKYNKEQNRKPYIGTMANESRLRKQQWIKNGCNAFDKCFPSSQPLSFWTEQDILHYIKLYNLDISKVYKDIVYIDSDNMEYESSLFSDSAKLKTTGANRTGCVFCMFGIGQDKERFLRLKEEEPLKYDYVIRGGKFDNQGLWIPYKGLGYKFVIDWLNEKGGLGIRY